MKIALVSFFDSERLSEYPITHSLGAMRLAAYLRRTHPEWEIRLRAFDERGFDEAEAAAALDRFDVVGLPAYIWTVERSRALALELATRPSPPLSVCGGPETRAMEYLDWGSGVVFVMGQGEDPMRWLCEQRVLDPGFDGRGLTEDLAQPVYSARRDRIRAYRYAVPDRRVRTLPHGVDLFGEEFLPMLTDDPMDTDFTWYETARGCIYDCSFCGHNTLPFFATFELDLVEREITNMRSRGIRRIFLIDPILGGKPARGKEILRLFQRVAPEIEISAYMRPEFLDEEFISVLVDTNIRELLMGLQTTNPSVPKHVRGNQFEKIMRFVPHLAERGVPWRAELIVGLPGDDLAGLRESLRFTIDELRPWSVHSYHLTAIPETKLFELLDREDTDTWIKADGRLRVVSSSSYSEVEMREMLAYAGAVTSLHAYCRAGGVSRPRFADLDGEVDRVLTSSDLWTAARTAFLPMSHERGAELWSSLGYVPAQVGV